MSQARNMGLTDDWVLKVEKANPGRHQLFIVRRLETLIGPELSLLKELDIVLSISGKTVTRIKELDVSEDWPEIVPVVLLRDKVEITLQLPTSLIAVSGMDSIVIWSGAILQAPHRAIRQQSKTIPSQVFVADSIRGSPSYQNGLVKSPFFSLFFFFERRGES